jgi:hypothetical protein
VVDELGRGSAGDGAAFAQDVADEMGDRQGLVDVLLDKKTRISRWLI